MERSKILVSENHVLNNKAFRNIDPEKLKILVQMLNEINNNPNVEQKMQVMMAYGMKMKQQGLQFSKEESAIIMDSMKQNLSPQEQQKIDMMQKMMSMM